MPATHPPLLPFLRFVRVLAAAQYGLSAIGLLFYALISIVDLYQYVAFRYLLSVVPHFQAPGLRGTVWQYLTLDPTEEIGAWKFGLVLLVIAAVYKRGVIMAQEAELTV